MQSDANPKRIPLICGSKVRTLRGSLANSLLGNELEHALTTGRTGVLETTVEELVNDEDGSEYIQRLLVDKG